MKYLLFNGRSTDICNRNTLPLYNKMEWVVENEQVLCRCEKDDLIVEALRNHCSRMNHVAEDWFSDNDIESRLIGEDLLMQSKKMFSEKLNKIICGETTEESK